MKRLLAFLALAGALCLLASCSGVNGTSDAPTDAPTEAPTEALTAMPADEKAEEDMVSSTPDSNTDSAKKMSIADFPEAMSVDSVEGKELSEFNTAEKTAGVFFDTGIAIRSAMLANDGILYFGNEDCGFFAVDIASKQQLWMYITEKTVQTLPVFSNGMIVFNAGNSLYALNAETGAEIFKVTHENGKIRRLSEESYTYNDTGAAVSDGVAYYIALNGDLVAVDLVTGKIIWTIPAVNEGTAGSGVNVYEGKLYWVDHHGVLCCADTNTQEIVFQLKLNDKIYAPMHIADGNIYMAGRRCKIYCIDAESGDVVWSSFTDDESTWLSGGSVCVGDTVYTGTSDRNALFAYDKETGEFKRMYSTETNVYTQPLLNGDNVILAATNVYTLEESYVMELDTENHTKLWQAYIEDGVLSSPAIYDGVIYFGSESGKVYCINLE